MRRVITVNLSGNAYELDEDAYERLRAYLATVESRLGANPDRTEIMADLERSIATHLTERRTVSAESIVKDVTLVEVLKTIGPIESSAAEPGLDPQAMRPSAENANVSAPPAAQRWREDESEFTRLPVFVLCLFLGWIGMHRFYVGKIGTGILQLLTIGGLGLWTLYDLILLLLASFTDADGRKIVRWT